MNKILVSTRLEEPTYKAVQALAQQQERKVAFLVRKAVEQFVRDQQKGAEPLPQKRR